MTDQLKQLRLDLDGLAQLVQPLRPLSTPLMQQDRTFLTVGTSSDQLQACIKSLFMAKAWAGKLLGEIGDPTPYKNDGKRKDVADIEPTDARVTLELKVEADYLATLTHIEKVDWLRQALQQRADYIKFVDRDFKLDTREKNICRTQIWMHLVEARLHLGFELERIRNSQ